MSTVNEITQSIITQARLIDPNISLEVGTPERKIVEAVAEAISIASVDIEVLTGQLYLDELAGSRIDSFTSLFGFSRQIGTRASGIVTLSRDGVGTYDTTIPKGTQFSTRAGNGIPGLVFVATETVVLSADSTSVLVRVECTTIGGIGNIPTGAIDSLPNSINIPGISRVTNEVPTSGGMDSESDEQLKIRFQNTIFRNMAGTVDQFLALCLSHPAVTKANVIGPQSKYVEYIQVPTQPDTTISIYSNGSDTYTTSISSVPYSKYTFSNNYYLAQGSGKDAKFLKPGKDYVFNNPASYVNGAAGQNSIDSRAPNVTLIGTSTVTDGVTVDHPGNVLFFEHTYLSKASRNDWSQGIYNCVDVYVNGQQSQLASSEEAFPSVAAEIVGRPDSTFYYKNYVRTATNEHSDIGNKLHVFYFQPMIDIPSMSITIGETVYYEAKYVHPRDTTKAWTTKVYYKSSVSTAGETPIGYYVDKEFTIPAAEAHYFVVEDVSSNRGTVRANNGVEWLSSVRAAQGSSFGVDYNYNLSIWQLQAVLEGSKQITTDPLVHASTFKYFRLYLTVMYVNGFTEENVNKQIYDSVTAFLNTQYYGTTIQMSDILQVVHNTSGVDNVRWTYETSQNDINNPQHKLEVVTKYGNSFAVPTYKDKDFILNDDELPALADIAGGDAIENALVIVKKAQNTWESN